MVGDRSRQKEGEEKKHARDPSLQWNKGALIMAACAYILLYKEALGRKIKLSKNKCITTVTKGITMVMGPEDNPYIGNRNMTKQFYRKVKGY